MFIEIKYHINNGNITEIYSIEHHPDEDSLTQDHSRSYYDRWGFSMICDEINDNDIDASLIIDTDRDTYHQSNSKINDSVDIYISDYIRQKKRDEEIGKLIN